MKTNDGKQHEIDECRARAREFLDEAGWIRRQFDELPFSKRQKALTALRELEKKARRALRRAIRLDCQK